MKNESIIEKSWWTLVVLVSGFHLFTLDLYPLPWFDEVYFASIVQSYLNKGVFFPSVVKTIKGDQEALAYGPMYFWLVSYWVKITAFTSFNIRFLALIMGLVSAVVLYRISKSYWSFLLLLDPFYGICFHHSRMETTAIFFILCAVLLLKHKYIYFSSLLFACAFLTTPRVFIFIVPLLLYAWLQKIEITKIVVALLAFFVIYGSWVFYKFGSLSNWFEYYRHVMGGNPTAAQGYFGLNIYLPKHEYLLIAVTSVLLGVHLYFKKAWTAEMIFAFISIISFYLFIIDWGYNSALILPIIYLLLLELYSDMELKLKPLILTSLFTFGVVYLGYKTYQLTQIDFDWKERTESSLKTELGSGDRIIGPARFFFLANALGCDYQLHDKYGSPQECVDGLTNDFDYEYLILSRDNAYSQAFLKSNTHQLRLKVSRTSASYGYTENLGFRLYKRD